MSVKLHLIVMSQLLKRSRQIKVQYIARGASLKKKKDKTVICIFLVTVIGHCLERCAKTFRPTRLTKQVFLCITIGRLQEPNNCHSAALCAFTNLINMMHFR